MRTTVGAPPQAGSGLAGRAILAVALLLGFYTLALGIAGGLLYLLYAMVVVAERVNLKVALLLIMGAGAILWSILPRIDRFEVPGPRLYEADHPRLFAMIRAVAQATLQTMPAEVYLVADMNAWVSQRGGVMGFGSRRIMGLGLPLLQMLNTSQLKAVLAHEFGHYHGGDVKLGPWIYKTRGAIGRTIMTLHQANSTVMHKPFEWYGNMFLRVTHAISRSQEFQADALAAVTVGPGALIDGLKAVHGGALAFDVYLNDELEPVLGAGYLPPIAEGFGRFVSTKQLSEAIEKVIGEEMKSSERDPYDTHPPLPERIAALSAYQGRATENDETPAVALLDHLARLERELLGFILVHPERLPSMKTIAWSEVGEKVYPDLYRKLAPEFERHVGDAPADQIPLGKAAMAKWAREKVGTEAEGASDEDLARFAARAHGVLTLRRLSDLGWTLHTSPGETITAARAGVTVQPLKVLMAVASDEAPAEDWQALCAAAGLMGMSLRSGAVEGKVA